MSCEVVLDKIFITSYIGIKTLMLLEIIAPVDAGKVSTWFWAGFVSEIKRAKRPLNCWLETADLLPLKILRLRLFPLR